MFWYFMLYMFYTYWKEILLFSSILSIIVAFIQIPIMAAELHLEDNYEDL